MLGVQAEPFALLTGAAVPVCLAVAYYAWRRRPRPGAGPFTVVMVTAAAWAGLETLNLVLVHPSTYEVRTGVREGVALLLPVAWVAFALAYTGREELVTRWSVLGLALPGAVSALIVALGDPLGVWLGTCTETVRPTTGIVGAPASCMRGPWFFVHSAYGYVLMALGAWLVVRVFLARRPSGRRVPTQALALTGGLVPPILANLAWATGMSPMPNVDLTTPGLAFTGVVWGYALFRSDLLGVVPGTSRLGERTAIDDLSDSVVVVDDTDRVVAMNDAAAETFDHAPADARGESVETLVDADVRVVPGDFTTELETAAGRRSLEVTVAPVDDADDRRIGHTLVFRDVTERIQREQQLEALNRVLRHNLRNDMNVVRGYAATLSERVDEPEAGMAEAIAEQSADLVEVGSKVRQMERVMEGETGDERVEVGAVLREVVADLREEFGDGRVLLHVPEDLWVDADRLVLRTVLRNLLDNALRHAEDPDVEVVARAATGRWIEVEIADDGPGIPAQEREALESGETALRHGSGLGLWVVNWGVTALGGDFEFLETDGGTTVAVRLSDRVSSPADDVPEAGADADADTSAGAD